MNRDTLGMLPENVKVYPYVDQLHVLSRADVFITHCGMNSVSESLYMAAPMVLYPQTGEQQAVAKRTAEIGAGIMLTDDSANGIRTAVQEVLGNSAYAAAAKECSLDFRSCSGTEGAAEFIENAPHTSESTDMIQELNKANGKFMALYWLAAAALIILVGCLVGWKYVWIIGVGAGLLSSVAGRLVQKKQYEILKARLKKQ